MTRREPSACQGGRLCARFLALNVCVHTSPTPALCAQALKVGQVNFRVMQLLSEAHTGK